MSTSSPTLAIAIMAAGKGTRMKSPDLPKVMHTLAGRSMIMHVLHAANQLHPEHLLPIIGHHGDKVRSHVEEKAPELMSNRLTWVEQKEQKGTGHAVQQLIPHLKNFSGQLIIINGDVPLLNASTLTDLLKKHLEEINAATLLTTTLDDPTGYGRIVKNNADRFLAIREHNDCTPAELRIKEVNTGIYIFNWEHLAQVLPELQNDNAKGEYYLTDVLGILASQRYTIGVHCMNDPSEVQGINSRRELAYVEGLLQKRLRNHWMDAGVMLRNPDSIMLDCEVTLESDVEILPGTLLKGKTHIETGCVIGPHSVITDAYIGENTVINQSVVTEAKIYDHVNIGPFAHIRPNAEIASQAKVGNFVELKNTRLGKGSKASHLSYLGDAEIGEGCNIGAGTITCNYDGAHKHKTEMANGVFVGSNSTLVAPLNLEDHAYVAAGSTLTEDVPAGALALGRSRQTIKAGWVESKAPRK